MKVGTKLYNKFDNSFAEIVGESDEFEERWFYYKVRINNSNNIVPISYQQLSENWIILNDWTIKR